MGVVYRAERADGHFQQTGALKLVSGLERGSNVARFERERQILAGLDHPGIARLLDGGLTDDDRPYLVMELVDGEPIDRYCDRNNLRLPERLRLFLDICDAVESAHRSLVVHRDLKPHNILVTPEGRVKLLDFGIAKLLDEAQDRPSRDAKSTTAVDGEKPAATPPDLTAWLLTPEFASPEQFRNEPITVASDVYQLGLVLYVLLTGRKAIDLSDAAAAAWPAIVCARRPQPPSRTARREGSPVAPRLLTGDLDAIVRRALRKSPHDRYQAVGALAEDLRRHLASQPVQAHPASWPYSLRKFVGRHTAGVATASIAAALLISMSVFHTTRLAAERDAARQAAHQAEQARVAAEKARQEAEEVSRYLVDIFRVADPRRAPGASVTARQLLDQGAERIDRQLADQPNARARLLQTMAVVYRNLGLYQEAARLLLDVAELREAGVGDNVDRVTTWNLLSSVRWRQMHFDEAKTFAERALDELADHERGSEAATTFRMLGNIEAAGGNWSEAAAWYRHALDAAVERDPQSLNNLGVALFESGQLDDAEAIHQENLTLRRELHGPVHNGVGQSLYNLGEVLLSRGDSSAALDSFQQAVETYEQVYSESHNATAEALRGLGRAYESLDRHRPAAEAHAKALQLRVEALPEGHPAIAQSHLDIGRVLRDLGEKAEALRHAEDALRIFEEHPVSTRADRIRSRVLLAQLHLDAAQIQRTADVLRPVGALRREPEHEESDVRDLLDELSQRLRDADLEVMASSLVRPESDDDS